VSVEALLFARLAATGAVTALLGTAPVRVYPVQIPEEAPLPHARYVRIGTERPAAMTGYPGLSTATFQIDSWAVDDETAKACADAIRGALAYWRDEPNGVQGCLIETESSDFEDDRGEYRVMLIVDVFTLEVDA
jgi:hypothetical protein